MDIFWIMVIGMGVIFFGLIRFKEVRHRTSMIFFVILLLGALLSARYVYKEKGADLTTINGAMTFGKTYMVWLTTIFHNAKSVTGDVIGRDWTGNLSSVEKSTINDSEELLESISEAVDVNVSDATLGIKEPSEPVELNLREENSSAGED